MKKISVSGLVVLGFGLLLASCSKEAGPGGTSSIKGNVKAVYVANPKPAEAEVTTVICNHANGVDGSILDNSDYFLMNTPNSANYYVWYENTNWPGQDPGLSGRTGVKVTYSNSNTNVEIASATATALQTAASSDFNVTVSNDIVTITCLATGDVVDADDVNTPFVVDVLNQGKSAVTGGTTGTSVAAVDERVYIIYGDQDFYSESVRTDADGNFQFVGLTKGTYRIYTLSLDSVTSGYKSIERTAEITKNKEVVTVEELNVIL